jgi:4-amino-4-deoxy-L-arabinose transferase-like glycosyltransferase
MSDPDDSDLTRRRRDRRLVTILIVTLLGTATCFRLMRLSSVPGISGDEGWWGVQAHAWVSNRPYEAHTTSGNPTDLFFLIPVALVQKLAPPSFLLLRTVPTLVNLLAIPIGFLFVRRLYGNTTAWMHAVGLAVLPTAIAHSRICQDPSQSIFWTSLVIYLSLLGVANPRRAWWYGGAALVTFAVALWTHPTNVFVAAFLLLPCLSVSHRLASASRSRRAIALGAVAIVVTVGLLAAWPGFRDFRSNPYMARTLSTASTRMTDGAQWFEFAANNARLFNGVTIYHYFSGARPPTIPYDVGFVIVVGAALSGLLLTAATRPVLDYRLVVACAIMWLGFYAFAGPQALRPHAERWGLCLIAPATLVVARGLTAWMEWSARIRSVTIAAAGLVAASLLTSFYLNYFRTFATTGGRSHLAYVTAPIEPKQQALEYILARAGRGDRITIATQQWWLFWPIAYLATEHPNVSVLMNVAGEHQGDLQDALESGGLFFVEFAATPELAKTNDWIVARGLQATATTVHDASGRDLLNVLRVVRAH